MIGPYTHLSHVTIECFSDCIQKHVYIMCSLLPYLPYYCMFSPQISTLLLISDYVKAKFISMTMTDIIDSSGLKMPLYSKCGKDKPFHSENRLRQGGSLSFVFSCE